MEIWWAETTRRDAILHVLIAISGLLLVDERPIQFLRDNILDRETNTLAEF
jgi:hypothetical protein